MSFNPLEWWRKWHPDKANGRGREKSPQGKAGTGRAPSGHLNPSNDKARTKSSARRRDMDGRVP